MCAGEVGSREGLWGVEGGIGRVGKGGREASGERKDMKGIGEGNEKAKGREESGKKKTRGGHMKLLWSDTEFEMMGWEEG